MSEFMRLMNMVIEFMHTPITMDGLTFTPWGIVIFTSLGTIVMVFIHDLFD